MYWKLIKLFKQVILKGHTFNFCEETPSQKFYKTDWMYLGQDKRIGDAADSVMGVASEIWAWKIKCGRDN